jgi:hypothetical protein
MTKIYVDYDGVLFDWNVGAHKVMPSIPLVGVTDDFSWEELHKLAPNLYRELPLMWDARVLWDYIRKHNPEGLTAIPRRWHWPDCCAQKREAAWEHFGPNMKTNFGPFAVDKQFHCLTPSDVLIDDSDRNIIQWRARGGIGIHHLDAYSTIKALKSYNL